MGLRRIAVLSSLLAALATAQQQGVISNGNSRLPQCATSCPLLVQAAQACTATNTATQSNWICFCQSAYLTNLYQSATGICDSSCTNPSDLAQVSTWYKSNCGTDKGASEHASDGNEGGAASTTTTAGQAAATPASSTKPAAAAHTTAKSSSSNTGGGAIEQQGTWWEEHYKWIIMLIILAICLPLIAVLAVWLKRRHDRKQDQIREGFNAGITQRAGPMKDVAANMSGSVVATGMGGSGRNTPTRTREAFMPYGYGYNRSESRLGSKQAVHPAERALTPVEDLEKAGPSEELTPAKKKKVLVREMSAEDSIQNEKDTRL